MATIALVIQLTWCHAIYAEANSSKGKQEGDAPRGNVLPPLDPRSNMQERVSKLLREKTFKLFPAAGTPTEKRLCQAVITDLAQSRNVEYPAPVLITDRSDHPELAGYRACIKFDHARRDTEDLLRYEGLELTTGDHHFRLYRLPTSQGLVEVIYGEFKDENRLNRFDNYRVVNLKQCRTDRVIPVASKQFVGRGPNESAIIKWSRKYLVLTIIDDGGLAMELSTIDSPGLSDLSCLWNAESK
ncbi:MAG: hypothetical protein ACRD88_22460 [Terriglobia bacterium]